MMKFSQPQSHTQSGFTLVELMVSLSLFIIVVLALVGSLYNVNDASRKVQAMRTVMDNLNFAVESMSRTIRTGEDITCSESGVDVCPIASIGNGQTNDYLSVRSTLGENARIEYQWVVDANQHGRVEKRRTELNDDGTPIFGTTTEFIPITSPEINVEKFSFYVSGVGDNDGEQPNVIINMQGVASAGRDNVAPFSIQTFLSQRAPE